MNMLAVSSATAGGGSVCAAVRAGGVYIVEPGNEIMAASNYTFQSDTFSAAGAIGSLAGDASDPVITTGRWSLDDPKYGVADQEQETTAASDLLPEGSGMYDNITERFRLPQLPNRSGN